MHGTKHASSISNNHHLNKHYNHQPKCYLFLPHKNSWDKQKWCYCYIINFNDKFTGMSHLHQKSSGRLIKCRFLCSILYLWVNFGEDASVESVFVHSLSTHMIFIYTNIWEPLNRIFWFMRLIWFHAQVSILLTHKRSPTIDRNRLRNRTVLRCWPGKSEVHFR